MKISTHCLTLPLEPQEPELEALKRLLESFEDACEIVQDAAIEHSTRDRSRLHHLLYRTLCPDPLSHAYRGPKSRPLPSQYAVLAIGRVIHQLRARANRRADPYRPNTFDVDARTLDLDTTQQEIRLASLHSYNMRGQAAKDNRLRIPFAFTGMSPIEQVVVTRGRFVGGSIWVLPDHLGLVFLEARFDTAGVNLDLEDLESFLSPGHA